MSEVNGYAELHGKVDQLLRANDGDPVAQVAGTVALAAEDAAVGWEGLARDLERAVLLADRGDRWKLTKAKARCETLAKTARKLERDIAQVLND